MKFSIRDILGLVVLVALGMIVWRTIAERSEASARSSELQAEIKAMESRLFLTGATNETAVSHQLDGFDVIAKMRKNGVDAFEKLSEKYGAIEPTENFSIREIPSARFGTPFAPHAYRMFVPKGRSVWLKWGVRSTKRDTHKHYPSEYKYLRKSPFADSGPFERKLTSGTHTLVVSMGKAADGRLPFQVSLDDEMLLDSAFVSKTVHGFSRMGMSLPDQRDYSTTWVLLTINMRTDPVVQVARPKDSLGFSIWFEKDSTDFAEFPGKRLSQGSVP